MNIMDTAAFLIARSSAVGVLTAAMLSHPVVAATAPDRNTPINSIRDIAPKIGSCWHPPHTDDEVTIRLSFTREGTLIGRPRVSFMKVSGKSGPDLEVELANSILKAVYDCTPLQFTPEFGASVAGRVIAIRFVAPPAPTRGAQLRSPYAPS
jgi:hypothetical protein